MIERLRALEKAVELVAKATPGPWLYRAKSNTFHGPPPEGTNYSFGYSIMDPDEDYPTFKHEDIDALLAAVNFIREHGSALIAELGQEVGAVAWMAENGTVVSQAQKDMFPESLREHVTPLYTSPAHTSEARDAELPGMWSKSDFTGGDPDERSHHERALAADVARYRWLRDNRRAAIPEFQSGWDVIEYVDGGEREYINSAQSLDDAIDAAMRQEGGK